MTLFIERSSYVFTYEITICRTHKYANNNNCLLSEIPVFAVVTKIDKCDLTQQNLERKKNELCEAINITPDKLLLCSNYQPDPEQDIEKDIDILKFLIKVNYSLNFLCIQTLNKQCIKVLKLHHKIRSLLICSPRVLICIILYV